ncbi:MAG: glycosyltransferase, partial [Ignavibacteriales bacterium]|nr:glycosyltransferase [Ignavibacteriales bacterium]
DYRDLWSKNPRWSFPTPLHRKIVERMEYNSLKEAEKLTVTNRSMKERIINVRKFIKHTDVAIVYTGYDPDDFAEHVEPPKREKTVFAHLGNASNRRGLRFLFKALAELKAENPALADEIRFRFIGLLRKSDRKAIVKNGISSMIIEDGYLEHKQAIRALRESDVSYISVRDDGFGELFIVGAAAETFAAGKPIVAALPEGALRTRIEEYGACRFADPNSPRAIRRAIEQAHEERKKGTLPTPNEEAVKRFSYDEQVEQLAKIFQFSITEKR